MPVSISDFEVVVNTPPSGGQAPREQSDQQPAPAAIVQVQLQEMLRRQAGRMARLRAH